MMKPILILGLCMCGFMLNAQTGKPKNDENPSQKKEPAGYVLTDQTLKKDTAGNVITNEQFEAYMSTGQYTFLPTVKGDRVVEVQLQTASPEQIERFKEIATQMQSQPKPAPDFDITDMAGNRYRLSELKDKTVVINFWFTACVPCVAEIPALNQLAEENKNVVFIAITHDSKETVKKFLARRKFGYRLVTDQMKMEKDYGVSAFPTHLIIRNGIIEQTFLGSSNIKEKLQAAINGKPAGEKVGETQPQGQMVLTSDSDVRDEAGNKLDMMKVMEMLNSQKYEMKSATDLAGNKYILLKKKTN